MARETTTSTPDQILQRIRTRLISVLDKAHDTNTYLSTLPDDPPAPNPGEVMFEISLDPSSLRFDQRELVGAGRSSVHTSAILIVTIHLTLDRDAYGRDAKYLTHATLGAIPLLTGVLSALCEHDLLDEDGNAMLSHFIKPSVAHISPRKERYGFVSLSFDLEFDWYIPVVEP